jgi:hypothetical protein
VRIHRHRRQLSKSQLALIAAKMLEPLQEEARKRQGQRTDLNIPSEMPECSGEATDLAAAIAAKIVGTPNKKPGRRRRAWVK